MLMYKVQSDGQRIGKHCMLRGDPAVDQTQSVHVRIALTPTRDGRSSMCANNRPGCSVIDCAPMTRITKATGLYLSHLLVFSHLLRAHAARIAFAQPTVTRSLHTPTCTRILCRLSQINDHIERLCARCVCMACMRLENLHLFAQLTV